MTLEALSEFLATSPEELEKVKACKSYAEVSAIASNNGIEVTPYALMKAAVMSGEVKFEDMDDELEDIELDAEALEAIAGGAWHSGSDKATENNRSDAHAIMASVLVGGVGVGVGIVVK